MAVYVDWLVSNGWVLRGRRVQNCHLFADSEKELVEFAEGIGLKARWLQTKRAIHFDLTAAKREAAVNAGAVELSKQTWRDAYRRAQQQAGER